VNYEVNSDKTALEKRICSEEEYLMLEENSLERHEYFQGEIFAVAGGSPSHDLIGGNLRTELNIALRSRPCRVHGGDMKLKVEATG
jgi:Uma2 family endonuclease